MTDYKGIKDGSALSELEKGALLRLKLAEEEARHALTVAELLVPRPDQGIRAREAILDAQASISKLDGMAEMAEELGALGADELAPFNEAAAVYGDRLDEVIEEYEA